MTLSRFSMLLAVLLVALRCAGDAAAAAGRPDGRLASGGLGAAGASSGGQPGLGAARAVPDLPGLLLQRLEAPAVRALAAGRDVPLPGDDRPGALGDRLVVSLDDGLDPIATDSLEAALRLSEPAGATDLVAVRFPMQSLARQPPVRVTDVVLGLDSLHGAVSWPFIGLALEDGATPLRPGTVIGASFDAVAACFSPPPPPGTITTCRAPVGVPSLDVPDTWTNDGSFDDDFQRPDEPLAHAFSDWLECEGSDCAGASGLRVVGNRVVRIGGTQPALAVKFQGLDVAAIREARDLDLDVRVGLDLGASITATRAGLALRAIASDAFYRVEYVRSGNTVAVDAVTPGGVVPLASFPSPVPTPTPELRVVVQGVSPVSLRVFVNDVEAGVATDATYRYAGLLAGLSASDADGGEAWDDFFVLRRPDVFAVIRFPAGGSAALALDVSDDSLASRSVLVSADGSTWQPRSSSLGCLHPGNPAVQLEVEEVTNLGHLFENEAHVVRLEVDCPGCPTTRNACVENGSAVERQLPLPTVGQVHRLRAAWWNEHLSDADRLVLRGSAWAGPCETASALVATGAVLVGPDAGQPSSGPQLREADVMSFMPADPGPYCVVLEELHDLNADCCPDGGETVPLPGPGCPGACVPVAPADSNPSTGVVVRDLWVADACTPDTSSELVGDSLRVAHGAGNAVTLTWEVAAGFPQRFNVHLSEGGGWDPETCFQDVAPIVDRPVGVTSRTYDLPAPAGAALWMAVFQQDGCPSAHSLADDSAMDPALWCAP